MEKKFYVVGIGASAGGLETIQKLFDNMPEDTGMAFVIVQHLSPNFKSLMDELLKKHTKMPILLAEDRLELKPNHIYLNPKEKNILIKGGKIVHLEKPQTHQLNLPIDLFFHSLGNELEEKAIGIILSGTGTDGSRGIGTIKSAGGTVIVQEPKSAQFDGMPVTAINSGYAEFIAPPENIGEIIYRITSGYTKNTLSKNLVTTEGDAYNSILSLLYEVSGIDFSQYKNSTILRRLEKRISINHLTSLEEYTPRIKKDKDEQKLLIKDCLIGVTGFFRDMQAFNSIRENILPDLFRKKDKKVVRIWVTACSTGEEAYSLAILIDDFLEENNIQADFKIFATDLDPNSVQIAIQGKYPVNYITDIPKKYLGKCFIKNGDCFEIAKNIREKIVFSKHNLLKDPPFIKTDLISCRNLLIYLLPKGQQKVMNALQFSLKKGGFLFLGHSENLGELQKYFTTIDNAWRIFQNMYDYKHLPSKLQTSYGANKYESKNGIYEYRYPQVAAYNHPDKIFSEKISETFGPTGVFIDKNFQILYLNGNLNNYIEYKSGTLQDHLLDILVDDKLAAIIRNGVRRLLDSDKTIRFKDISFSRGNREHLTHIIFEKYEFKKAGYDAIFVCFEENNEDEKEKGSVVYDQYKPDETSKQHIDDLENELKKIKQELQNTIEELETSNEELQASNEELQASNEELQSTNEELQSVNEELYTVNAEVQQKNRELTELNDDMNNLLNSTEIGTLFLDNNLRIRKFTPALRKHFNLKEEDIGRPISSFASNFSEQVRKEFIFDSKCVLKAMHTIEKEFQDDDGNFFLRKITPFLTSLKKVNGVIITFVNITKLKESEQNYLALFNNQSSSIAVQKIVYDKQNKPADLEYVDGNVELERTLGLKRAELKGRRMSEFVPNFKNLHSDLISAYAEVAETGNTNKFELFLDTFNKWHSIKAFSPKKGLCATITDDITEEKALLIEIENAKRLKDTLLDNSPSGFLVYNSNGDCIIANELATKLLENSKEQLLKQNFNTIISWKQGKLYKGILDVLENGKNKKIIEKIITSQNEEAWFEYNLVRFFYNQKTHLMIILQDVTERTLNQVIIQSEEKYRAIANNFPDGALCLFDFNLRFIISDGKGLKLLGLSKEKMEGKTIFEVFSPDVSERTEEYYINALKGIPQNIETSISDKIFLNHYLPVKLSDSRIICGMLMIQDITKFKNAETKLKQQTAQLIQSEKMNAIGTLIAGVAHELNNPLMGIMNYTAYCQKHFPKDNKAYPVLNDLFEEACRSAEIVKSLLTFSRKNDEHGVEEFNTNLLKVLQNSIKIIKFKLKDKDIHIILPTGNNVPACNISPNYAQQLIFNILDNAIHAVENCKKRIIEVKIQKVPNELLLHISDTGGGIDGDISNKIFDPFFTTKPAGIGTGLGLSICKNIINEIGGDITFHSSPGKGTTFTLSFPITKTEEKKQHQTSNSML